MPSTSKPPLRAIQLALFQPSRNEPSWDAVPIEIQQQVLPLLVRMLREHVAHQHCEPPMLSEDRDE